MMASSVTETDLISWIEKSLESENISNYEITLTGKTEKGEGAIGEIVFANVNGITKENKKKTVDLVVKHGKTNEHLRKSSPVKLAYVNEIHFYDQVIPTFKKFQQENNVSEVFQSVPKCYATLVLENMEVLVLDNLKKQGYELHDKWKPLNSYHLRAVLKEYGKFHALSFALRDQKREEFNSLTDCRANVIKEFLFGENGFRKVFQIATDGALALLQERNDLHLFKKFKNLLVKDTLDMLFDLLEEEEEQSAISHGDCWNNNYLFKYEDDSRTSPSKVAILDWQMSHLRSPALDLSHFIYLNGSKEDLDKFDELMEIYYASFSNLLRELGSNPEEVFSYSDLRRHWRKYSLFGLLFAPMALRLTLCAQEEFPVMEELQEGENFGNKLIVDLKDKDLYYERVKGIISNYFEYVF